MKILLIGSKGMLGSEIRSLIECDGVDKDELDITNKDSFDNLKDYDVVINCAAYTQVDLAESEREACDKVNVIGVNNILEYCKRTDAILIHFSTDYVFDGKQEDYNENDKTNPLNYYGLSKMRGEELIINSLEKYYIIRTSWLFGKNGKNFVETIKKSCAEKSELKVVDDQFGKPTYAKDLAKSTLFLLKNIDEFEFGKYHITNSGKCSWFEFSEEIKRLSKGKCVISPCSTEEYPTPAKRPKSTVLNNNRFPAMRNWKLALKSYMEEII